MSNDPAVYTAKEYGALANNLPNHKAEPYYVTTAISYTNGYPHIGHAYEFISTDVLARYHRVLGYDTYFLTGTDEHGQKVAASAEKGGKTPLAHCDHYVESFKDLHKKLLVAYSKFIRTTDAYHELTSQQLWQKCADAGDIYLDSYEGWYNEREETFVTPAEAEASEFKDPGSGLPLKRVSEESYFFRMSKYCERLIAYIEENPSCIEPENHRLVILGRLKKEGLKDLSISRTSFSWGIPVPAGFDQRHVMYVWFDALTNYLSGVYGLTPDHPLYKYWPATKHIIGKDIVWFHCVIWPCMLMSAELPLPGGVFSHGFVNDEFGRKMSKSYNNTIDPFEILTKYPADSIRYYLSSCATYGADLNFSEKALIVMHNSELADILGNLVNRVVNLIQKYCGGVVPDTQHDPEFGLPFDLNALKTDVAVEMKSCGINGALFKAMEAARATNGFLTKAEPWKMKGENESRRGAVVRTALEAVYAFMHFLAPVIPMAAQSVFNMLHTDPVCSFLLKDDFYNLAPGTSVSVGEILFQKIEQPEDAKANAVSAAAPTAAAKGGKGKPAAAAAEPEAVHAIDFTKLELRVGQITKVWHHETAERLFCEEVDLGVEGGGVRQIASGLREHYTLEDMLHRKVIVVCNMKESKFQGFLSNGMILAAKSAEGKVELVAPNAEAAVGQRVYVQGHGANVPAALAAAQVKKLKVWETVSADLRTNGSCEACWKGLPMMTAGDLVCSVPSLADAVVT